MSPYSDPSIRATRKTRMASILVLRYSYVTRWVGQLLFRKDKVLSFQCFWYQTFLCRILAGKKRIFVTRVRL